MIDWLFGVLRRIASTCISNLFYLLKIVNFVPLFILKIWSSIFIYLFFPLCILYKKGLLTFSQMKWEFLSCLIGLFPVPPPPFPREFPRTEPDHPESLRRDGTLHRHDEGGVPFVGNTGAGVRDQNLQVHYTCNNYLYRYITPVIITYTGTLHL